MGIAEAATRDGIGTLKRQASVEFSQHSGDTNPVEMMRKKRPEREEILGSYYPRMWVAQTHAH
jgi:hypothetical protein